MCPAKTKKIKSSKPSKKKLLSKKTKKKKTLRVARPKLRKRRNNENKKNPKTNSAPISPQITAPEGGVFIGSITHFFPNVNAAVIKLDKIELRVGDYLCFKGVTTEFKQKISSIQIDRKPVELGMPGEEIGVQVKERVREGDLVYRIKEPTFSPLGFLRKIWPGNS